VKSLASNLFFVGLIAAVLYLVGDTFHILPSSVKNTVSWGASNFGAIVFLICFILVVYLIIRFTKHNKGGKSQQ